MILVVGAAVIGAEVRLAAGVGAGTTDVGGDGGVVGEGGRRIAAVINSSFALIIAAPLPPFVPAALPSSILPPITARATEEI